MSRAVRARLVTSNYRPLREIEAAHTPTDDRGQCVFLCGTAGVGRVSCRIYATRPKVCRDFKPGSKRCIAARREMESRHA
jgi:Fe-S-cluster containining protein